MFVLSRTTSYGFLAPCQNLEKTNDTIPRKRPDRMTEGWKDGWKDGQTLFHRTLPATAGCPKSSKMVILCPFTPFGDKKNFLKNPKRPFCPITNASHQVQWKKVQK